MKKQDIEEEMMLYDDEGKYDDVIDEEEVGCEGLQGSCRESIPVKRLEPQWDKQKSYL